VVSISSLAIFFLFWQPSCIMLLREHSLTYFWSEKISLCAKFPSKSSLHTELFNCEQ
jgi:hypothetical protein